MNRKRYRPDTALANPVRAGLEDLIRLQAQARALRLPARAQRSQPGARASRHQGRGMAFSEVRRYQPGDDVRSIDWRVTARRQAPHTRVYEEERERPVLILADLGPTQFFASTGAYKQARCAQAAALLAWLALSDGDRVGGLIINEQHLEHVRPVRRKASVLAFLDALARLQRPPDTQPPAVGGTVPSACLEQVLVETARVAHTGAHIFVLSDFQALTPTIGKALRTLARHNRVTALRLRDPLESQLPASGRFALQSADGAVWFNAADRNLRQAWQKNVDAHETELTALSRETGVTLHTLATGDEPGTAIAALLQANGRLA